MKKLSYKEFTELMSKKETITVVTNNGIYELTGITNYKVCVEFRFLLKEDYQIGEQTTIRLTNVVTTTEGYSMYMSF